VNRGITLIEIVVSITILSLVGMFSFSIVGTMIDAYALTQQKNAEINHFGSTLKQISRHIEQALPFTIHIQNQAPQIQLAHIKTGGFAQSLSKDTLHDPNAAFSLIQPGMYIVVLKNQAKYDTLPIQAVNSNAGTLTASGLSKNHANPYWVSDQTVSFSLEGSNIYMNIAFHGGQNASATHLICGGIQSFTVTKPSNSQVFLSLTGKDESGNTVETSEIVRLR
jgi:hypothetical protein